MQQIERLANCIVNPKFRVFGGEISMMPRQDFHVGVYDNVKFFEKPKLKHTLGKPSQISRMLIGIAVILMHMQLVQLFER